MGIQKDYYNKTEEGKIVGWHIIINVVNFVYHIVTIVSLPRITYGEKVTMATLNFWSCLMLVYLSFTLGRLIYYTKSKYFDAYKQYKSTFYTRAAAIYVSLFRCIWVQSVNYHNPSKTCFFNPFSNLCID